MRTMSCPVCNGTGLNFVDDGQCELCFGECVVDDMEHPDLFEEEDFDEDYDDDDEPLRHDYFDDEDYEDEDE